MKLWFVSLFIWLMSVGTSGIDVPTVHVPMQEVSMIALPKIAPLKAPVHAVALTAQEVSALLMVTIVSDDSRQLLELANTREVWVLAVAEVKRLMPSNWSGSYPAGTSALGHEWTVLNGRMAVTRDAQMCADWVSFHRRWAAALNSASVARPTLE